MISSKIAPIGKLLLVAAGILVLWALWASIENFPSSKSATEPKSERVSYRRILLDRVRKAASNRLPKYSFSGKDALVFFIIDERFSELEVREVVLAVETEFQTDLNNSDFEKKLGSKEKSLNLREHLTLQMLAEMVESKLKSPEESS